MNLSEVDLEYRIIIGVLAMVVLFTGFLISFITSQRKKLQYHKDLQALHQEQQQLLTQQNVLLEQRVKERTQELSEQKEALQASLAELHLAQAQLVQREKMAALGELTAGIAHEIQNPLNFINNFSEVSTEILDEILESTLKDLPPKQQKEAMANFEELKQNLVKISSHGKRADSIVKGMLQHSRTNKGQKEPTDLNILADEFFRLSYQGLRTKDKTFQATMQTSFDGSIGKINIVAQDLGRVLLNLFNNAFYSVAEKRKKHQNADFEPAVVLTTKKHGDKVEVTIRDNGMGIPAEILQKIFQPFYTTKPTGQGVGLGLSLSYDIIKAHGGELKVDTKVGEFAEFTVLLPVEVNQPKVLQTSD
ncbi:sensor histidine kinase [Rufibacter tibetensis]|uniref:histidine kinase n=1 Tax=Rufibacter tibetensis TaxID=512763 RepID=A0A0P0CVZ3_9BACT|nr:ATP-binding protein [Rufibacter tibetensis]ALI98694.1 histidine kinase [Rufibacter tibetensis]